VPATWGDLQRRTAVICARKADFHRETAMRETWFISGCSSGLGYAIAAAALGAGNSVVSTARDIEPLQLLGAKYPEHSHCVALDVTNKASIKNAVSEALRRFGAIDVLVNNAGALHVGSVEETSDREARALFDTNLFGALDLSRAILPGMRERRQGCIVNISSTGGIATAPGIGMYCATKHALEAMSEAMASELAPLGIKVLLVEPGAFRTQIGFKATMSQQTIADYNAIRSLAQALFTSGAGTEPGDPNKAALAILAAVEDTGSPLRLPLGIEAFEHMRAKIAAVLANFDACEGDTPDVRILGGDTGR
jgi:NADP-dependent 3-hydroxy acid dehydrogenase YdfG